MSDKEYLRRLEKALLEKKDLKIKSLQDENIKLIDRIQKLEDWLWKFRYDSSRFFDWTEEYQEIQDEEAK